MKGRVFEVEREEESVAQWESIPADDGVRSFHLHCAERQVLSELEDVHPQLGRAPNR